MREEAQLRAAGLREPGLRAAARAEAQGLLRRAHRGADRARDEAAVRAPAAQARPASGLQARRHLRRGVRDLDRLPVLDLRGGVRGEPDARRKIMILGGGPNRIGQGIEFDYCCVHAAMALREDGFETIMVNCNPETVSTDYDTSDRLYFEPLTLRGRDGDHREGEARGRDRAVRRPDAAEARRARSPRPGAPDHRHHARTASTSPRTASASRSW